MKSYLSLDLEPPPPNAIWVYLKQKKRKKELCFKKPLQRRIWNKVNYLAAHNDSSVRQLAISALGFLLPQLSDNASPKQVS